MEKVNWRLKYDHHTHTKYSDGKGEIEDSVRAAVDLGLDSIAITDHGPGHLFYGVKRKNLPLMRGEVERLKEKYPQIKIFLGVEANLVNRQNSLDVTEEDRQYLDFVLAGYHYGVTDAKCISNFAYRHGLPLGGEGLKKFNTELMVRAVRENDIYILTHPGDKGPYDMDAVARACEEKNLLMEINAHHPHLDVEEIAIAMKYNVRFIVSSDAHRPEHIGQVGEAVERALQAGLDLKRIVNLEVK